MANLHIIIKRKYFDQIVSGEKKKEYRIVKPYWVNKLVDRSYDSIIFQAGYRKDSPRHIVPYTGYIIENITHEFFGNEEISVFAILL
jgi:hypothetical protein